MLVEWMTTQGARLRNVVDLALGAEHRNLPPDLVTVVSGSTVAFEYERNGV